MDERSASERLDALESGLSRLEQRIAQLELAPTADRPTAAAFPTIPRRASGEGISAADHGISSNLFTQLAAVAFGLVGALALRVAAQQSILSPALGAATGGAYCGLLLAAPLLGRRVRWLRARSPLLQYCGISLAPLIVLEMAPRMQLGISGTTLMLFGVGVAGALAGFLSRAGRLACYGLLVSMLAIASSGFGSVAVLVRATAVVSLVGLAAILAKAKDWGFLRPCVWPVGGAILAGLALAAARGADDIPVGSHGMVVPVLAAWTVVAASCGWRSRSLAWAEAAWLPLVGLWAYALAILLAPSASLPAGIVVALAALGGGTVQLWLKSPMHAFAVGLAAMGALMMAVGLPILDPTGISLAAVAILTASAATWGASRVLAATSTVLALEASVRVLVSAWLLPFSGALGAALALPGLGIAIALFLHARLTGGRSLKGDGSALRSLLASLSLLAGAVVLASTYRAAVSVIVPPGEARQLGDTVALAALAVGMASLGRAWSIAALRVLGCVAIILLAVIVVFRDFASLTGVRLLGSVVTMGVAFLGISFAMRRRPEVLTSGPGFSTIDTTKTPR